MSIVARIAYLSSDVVLSVQPSLGRDSEFSHQLRSLAADQAAGLVSKRPDVRLS